MAAKGTGSTFSEAFDDYLDKSEMCDSAVVTDLRASFKPSTAVSPLYVGVNVNHTVDETLDYLTLFNRLNKEYLSLFLPFLEKSELHPQSFTKPGNQAGSPKQKGLDDPDEPALDRSVLVLGDHEDVALLDHFHVTLYYLGLDKRTPESVQADVDKLSKYLDGKDPGFTLMLNTLTLYEFSVCLMYRQLYRMPFPFERTPTPEESAANEEVAFFRYLVLVPGVVFFAVTELKKPLFALPSKDFEPSKHAKGLGAQPADLQALLKSLKDSVLIETDHCTHVTLGTSKDYKAVISNQVCNSLRHFLESDHNNKVHLHSHLKASNPGTAPCHSTPDDLKNHLKVFNSGPVKYSNVKDVFVNAVPYLLTHDPSTKACGNFALEPSAPHAEPLKESDLYSKTKVFVSDDYKWFYFKNLPATHNLHPDPAKERFDWLIDVYVVGFDKQVRGNIHFNQK